MTSDDSYVKDNILMEILMRLGALEKLLIKKNIISESELTQEVQELFKKVTDIINIKVNENTNVQDFVSSMEQINSEK